MTPRRPIVFFPCHSLDDFPVWLGDAEAEELMAAWTAAWHPRLIAAAGRIPAWASVETPPGNDVEVLGFVTAQCDDRLAGVLDTASTPGSRWVRRAGKRENAVAQALAAIGAPSEPPTSGAETATTPGVSPADFHAFGLAWLLSELLARRMRSTSGLGSAAPFTGGPADEPASGFEERLVAAARAWEAGDGAASAEALKECYGHLEAARARYYPVDIWLVDLVLLAETTLGARLAAELDAPVPLTVVATGRLIATLAETDPELTLRLRRACDAGRVAPAGGRYDGEPLDACLPETIRESFLQGHRAWRNALGRVPATFAQVSGGWTAMLPQILTHFGYAGVIWNLFDGTPLPDPGTGRIRWEGSGGACVDGLARPPLDARRASTILTLADRIGDAIDHDHTAVVQFAHHAGLASPWFDDLRRIGGWTTALGTFVTPEELFRRTAGAGTLVSWEPDSYPVSRPPGIDPGQGPSGDGVPAAVADPIGPRIESCRAEAKRIVAGRGVLAGLPGATAARPTAGKRVIRQAGGSADVPTGTTPADRAAAPPAPASPAKRTGGLLGGLARGLFGGGRDDRLVLEHDRLRIRIHPVTGGLLSVRRPTDRGNRLSQHLALRSTRPAPPVGAPWEDPQERAEYASAVADRVERTGARTVESRGRILDPKGRRLAEFTQTVELLSGLPMARLDVEVALDAPLTGAVLEHHAACRFAWNENDDLDLRRGLHDQGVASERTLLTAPHFLTLRAHAHRQGPEGEGDDITILTGGLPWHLRSSPHTLDTLLLAGDSRKGRFSLAVGLGLARPWDAALDLVASGGLPAGGAAPAGPRTEAANVRLTWQGPLLEAGQPIGVRVGIVESEGRGGDVTVDWGFDIAAARICDALGKPIPGQTVTLAGRRTTTFVRRYGWLAIDLLFPGGDLPPEWTDRETEAS